FDSGDLRQGAEGEPPGLEGAARPDEAGQPQEPDRNGSAGNSPQGTGGSFALRFASGRQSLPRRGNVVHPPSSYVARLKASSRQPTLFDALPQKPTDSPASENAPPTAITPSPPDHFYYQSHPDQRPLPAIASGEKGKARDLIAAIKAIKYIESENR